MMAVAFGATALVVVAVSMLVLLVEKNEHRKLRERLNDFDRMVREAETLVTAADRERRSAVAARDDAIAKLSSNELGFVTAERTWAEERAGMEEELQRMEDELNEVSETKGVLEKRAKSSLSQTDIERLPLRDEKVSLVDARTLFGTDPHITLLSGIPELKKQDVEAGATESMRTRGVPTRPVGYSALVEVFARVHLTTAGTQQVVAVSISVRMRQPLIVLDLSSVSWVCTLTESGMVVTTDKLSVADLVRKETAELTRQLLNRAYGGQPTPTPTTPQPSASPPAPPTPP
jgi:hypothetical protein